MHLADPEIQNFDALFAPFLLHCKMTYNVHDDLCTLEQKFAPVGHDDMFAVEQLSLDQCQPRLAGTLLK